MKALIMSAMMAIGLNSMASVTKEDIIRINFRDGRSEVVLLGGSGAHGGDFYEMNIHNFGWQVFELVKKGYLKLDQRAFEAKLSNLIVEVVEDVSLNDLSREAVNIPEFNKWYITMSSYNYITNVNISFESRVQFFLHEFLPLMGELDFGYRRSDEYTVTAFEEIESLGSELKVVLYTKYFSREFEGAELESMERLCERIKAKHKSEYFTVYCIYKEKENVFSKRGKDQVYGIKVLGLGPVEKLEKKYIIRADVDDMPLYKSSAEALYNCYSIIAVEDDADFSFYKAECELVTYPGGYKFNIVTLNPYVKN